jgi:hypothetical protein
LLLLGINFNGPSDSEIAIIVPCGAHKAYIPCNYTSLVGGEYSESLEKKFPIWIINSTTYVYNGGNPLPDGFEINGTSLVVTDISKSWLNNTLFFCQLQKLSDTTNPSMICKYNSSARQLIINQCEGISACIDHWSIRVYATIIIILIAPRIECIPVYSHERDGSLQRINTTLNLADLEVLINNNHAYDTTISKKVLIILG